MRSTSMAFAGNRELRIESAVSETVVPGGFWIRFIAAAVDGIIVTIVSYPLQIAMILGLGLLIQGGEETEAAIGILASLCTFPLTLLYYCWFYSNKGATPGKMLFGLKVVDSETGEYIGWGKTIFRNTIGLLLNVLTLYIGFIMAGVRKDKRGLHDLVSGTRVIRVRH